MAGAAAAAAAAMHRISEKRSRAHQEEMMTKEEMEERDRQRAIRAAEARAARFVEIKEISAELATPGLSPRCIEMHIILRDNGRFQAFIIGVICIAGILVGVNTYPINSAAGKTVLLALENLIVLIFMIEIYIKLIAEGKRPWLFFTDGWNIFDFFIVVAGFIPMGGGGAIMVLRLLRLLRVLKLVKALPKLRILVIGLIKSFSAIAYIGMLLMLLFYLFAVLGVSLYGQNDPVHMGNLHIALISLFRAATGEDWTDLMYTAMFGCRGHAYDGMMHLCTDENNAEGGVVAALYWVVFLTFASLMILNLFIGVITGAMEDAKSELEAERLADAEADGEAQTSDTEESKDVDSSGDENQDVESAMPVRSPSMLRQMSQKLDQELEIKFNALAVIFREIADDIASMKQNEDMRVEEIRESRLGLTQASPGDGGTDSSGEVQQSSPLSAVSDLDELIKDTAGDGLDSL